MDTEIVHPTTEAADAIRRSYGFSVDERPNVMLERVFFESDPSALQDLPADQLSTALVWWLSNTLAKCSRDSGDGRVVDGRLLLAHFDALPEAARQVFPESAQMRIEMAAEDGAIQIASPVDEARALLAADKPRGPTVREVREQAQRNKEQGLLRSGRLYRKPQKPTGDEK